MFKNYTVEEGLSQSQIHCMLQDSKSYLWFGTDAGGLCKFDGKVFSILTTTDGLADNKVFSLCESPDGKLWIGTDKGISIYNGATFEKTPVRLSPLNIYSISFIHIDSKGITWIGTPQGVYSWSKGTLQKNNTVSGFPVRSIFEDSDHHIWVGSNRNGLFDLSEQRIKKYEYMDGLASDSIWSIIEPVKGTLWIGTDKGVSIFNVASKTFENPAELKIPSVRWILQDHNNEILILTEGQGIYKYNKKAISTITTKQGLPTDILWCGLKDAEGNVWIGTDGNGVIKYQLSPFSRLSDQNGLFGNIVLSILEDSKGNFWYGTEKGSTRISTDPKTGKQNFSHFFGGSDKHPGERIWSTKEDSKGNIWFTTFRNGVYKYDGHNMVNYTEKDGLGDDYVRSLFPDENGKMWIATVMGLNYYDGKEFKLYKRKNGLPHLGVMSLFRDSRGDLWLATNGGLAKFNPEGDEEHKFIGFSETDGLPSNGLLSVTEDSDGNIWCAGFKGISKVDIKTKTCKTINISNGLSSNSVYILVGDKKGNLFVGTNKGIDKIDVKEFNKTGTIRIKHFGKEEGFAGLECNSNAYCIDKQGCIWFGSINGAIRYNPERDLLNKIEPVTHITGLNLFFEKFDQSTYSHGTDAKTNLPLGLRLPYNKNHITFECSALSLTLPEKTMYSFMLEGFDETWTPPAQQNFATYTYLPPGNYKFLVKAMNNDGVWTSKPASISFSIDPPFWKTWWFYVLSTVAFVVVVYIVFKVRLQSLQNRAEELQKRVDKKTAQLQKEKETVEEQSKIIEKKNQNITASINYAQRIQNTVLPIKDNIKKIFPESFIHYKPKDIVSGDFYWFNEIENKIVIAAVDCTGHGIPGAFMSLIGNNLVNDVVTRLGITNPSQILYKLHEDILVTLKKSEQTSATVDGMDVSICVIDSLTNTLEFASTGQPLILIKNGQAEIIRSGKYPIGLVLKKERSYPTQSLALKKGDSFYLFTDGYIDQFDATNTQKFSEEGFKNFLLSIQDLSLENQEKSIDAAFVKWKGDLAQMDDVLIIGVKIG